MRFQHILLISVIIIFCSYQKSYNNKLTLTVHVDSRQVVDNVTYLLVKATLANISPDTFAYIVRSCFYPFPYTTDSKIFAIRQIDCVKNLVEFIKIPPGGTVETIIRFPIKENIGQLSDSCFRICAHLTSSNDLIDALNKENRNLIMFSSQDYKFLLHDTSYTIHAKLTTMDKNGSIGHSYAMTSEEIVWSNRINLNQTLGNAAK